MLTALSVDDAQALRDLDARIWNRSRDRFGHSHWFPRGDLPLSKADRDRVLRLVEKHSLPCVLHSGVYGDLSFSVYGHSDVPGVSPGRLITLAEAHFGLRGTFEDWSKRFRFMSKVTHTAKNREICEFYKLPLPKPSEDYEY